MVLQGPECLSPIEAEVHQVYEDDRVIITDPTNKETQGHQYSVGNIHKGVFHFVVHHQVPHVGEGGGTLS